ncbi:MAG: class I tRNA ligase family protein, partial [Candidatus Portnoybacteria bacterium]|nr:class I tRNA ligase family protein [Candidatus Portnoybacteria bacterium]
GKFTKEITRLMDSFKFYKAAEMLYHYFWHTFADKIIEESKERLRGENGGGKRLPSCSSSLFLPPS